MANLIRTIYQLMIDDERYFDDLISFGIKKWIRGLLELISGHSFEIIGNFGFKIYIFSGLIGYLRDIFNFVFYLLVFPINFFFLWNRDWFFHLYNNNRSINEWMNEW